MLGLGSSRGCVGATMIGLVIFVMFEVEVIPVLGRDVKNAVTIPKE